MSRNTKIQKATKLLAAALIAHCSMSCSRALKPREATAIIQAADLLTVHDAARLLTRFIELQQRLPGDILTHQDCPPLFRWDAIEPESLSANAIRDMGLEGTNFPELTAVATRPLPSPSVSEDQDIEDQGTEDQDIEDQDTEDQDIEDQDIEDQGTEDQDIEDQGTEDQTGSDDRAWSYLTLAPISNTSSASWPVIIISANGYKVVAANLRDYFAHQLITYAPPVDNPEFWMRMVSELWVGLRLGLADPAAIAQRRQAVLRTFDLDPS